MHLPKWPPDFDEWKPGNPFDIEPPLPRWTFNPWLTSEQMTTLEAETGEWAAHRAESMVPRAAGFEMARRAAYDMSRSFLSRLPPLPPTPRPRERKRREPTIAEELAPVVKLPVLTPEIEEELIHNLIESWEVERHTPRRVEEQLAASQMVVDWAEEKGVKIPGGKAAEIVRRALARGITVKV